MTKAIVVSPEEYFDYFKQNFPEWDVQHPVLSIEQMWHELGNGDLDVNSEIVILNDSDYADDNEHLEVAIRDLSGEALVMVIADDVFRESIMKKLEKMSVRDYVPVYKFWFIGRLDPVTDINTATEEYKKYLPKREQEKAANAAKAQPAEAPVTVADTQTNTENTNAAKPAEKTKTSSVPYEGDGYQGPRRNGMILASTSSKGGSGKSTVALCTSSMLYWASKNAADAGLVDRPLDVVVVDMDTRDGQIGFFLNESTPTVLNIVTSQDLSRNNIRKNLVYNERLGIHALLAPKRARTADYTTPEFYRDIISKLRTMFDVVILDTSVNYLDPLISEVVLPMADAVLFVTNMSRGSVFGMTRWIAEVTLPLDQGGSAAISKDKIGVVVNQSMGNVGFDQGKLETAAVGVPLLVAIPMDSAAVLTATNNNRLDAIVKSHPNISPAYYDLVKYIIGERYPLVAPDVNETAATAAAKAASGGAGRVPIIPTKKDKKKRWGK